MTSSSLLLLVDSITTSSVKPSILSFHNEVGVRGGAAVGLWMHFYTAQTARNPEQRSIRDQMSYHRACSSIINAGKAVAASVRSPTSNSPAEKKSPPVQATPPPAPDMAKEAGSSSGSRIRIDHVHDLAHDLDPLSSWS